MPMSSAPCTETAQRNLDRLLRPRSVALVGASSTPGSLGEAVLINLEEAGFAGGLHLVNPKRPVIRGRQCLGSIEELPANVDCAVLAIPGAAVLDSVRACARKSTGSVIVFSAGFAEGGEDGRAAQAEMARIARESGMVIEGPNCLGMVNYLDGIPLTFVATPPLERSSRPGVAIVSQSGALAAVIAVNMRKQKIPLTFSVSSGNEADSHVEDFLEHLIGDPSTHVIALVAEQFRQPKRFLALAEKAIDAGQYLVLLHPGMSGAARASAATHTGAIAGDYDVMRAMVTHAGVLLVESIEELVDASQLLVCARELPRAGAAVFTESGAFKALALDACERVGLALPALSPQAENGLREALPAFIPPSNPLDLTAQGLVDPTLYKRTLPHVLNDDLFGSVLLGIILTDDKTRDLKVYPILDAISGFPTQKPIVFAALDEGAPFESEGITRLRELGVACYPSPERAIRALANITRLGIRLAKREKARPAAATQKIALQGQGILSEFQSKQIMAEAGVKIPAGGLATSADEAVRIAREIGFPVALKAQSPDLPHKTEAGGIALGIDSETGLREAWEAVNQRVKAYRPDLVLDGLLVEKMGPRGLELIVGARNDPQWGPILLVGFGGVLAEALRDTRLLPVGLSLQAIKEELFQLRCAALLKGFRGAPAADVDALAELVASLGSLMQGAPEIAEVDINPVLVRPAGQGVMALDALIWIANGQA